MTDKNQEIFVFTKEDFEKMNYEELFGFYFYIRMDDIGYPDPKDYEQVYRDYLSFKRSEIVQYLTDEGMNK